MNRETWYGLVLSAVAVAVFSSTLVLPKQLFDLLGPRAFPQAISGLLFVFSVTLTVQSLLKQRLAAHKEQMPESDGRRRGTTSLVVLAVAVAYLFMLRPLGYLWATAVFLLGSMWFLHGRGARGLPKMAFLALLFAGGIYLTFTRVLGVMLP